MFINQNFNYNNLNLHKNTDRGFLEIKFLGIKDTFYWCILKPVLELKVHNEHIYIHFF